MKEDKVYNKNPNLELNKNPSETDRHDRLLRLDSGALTSL